mmetsp:Transcript_42615/g.46257  ORF Transcript_42615/g.46257 Transcript_42615/m.46257 type:complete len:114 (+) Transcript_42615:562-903(+)
MVPGLCIICLEEFMTGEVIVWSEYHHCNHFYHKDCVVPYFAQHQAQQPMTSSSTVLPLQQNNPCPTCRQQYCTVTTPILDTFLRQQQQQHNDEPTTTTIGVEEEDGHYNRWGV